MPVLAGAIRQWIRGATTSISGDELYASTRVLAKAG